MPFMLLYFLQTLKYTIAIDVTFSIPTPKATTQYHETTRDIQLKVHTLYYNANWLVNQICLQLDLTPC
jgi:hypothetical protein